MAPRPDLQALLLTFVPNVYFQPPPSLKMVYPCIVYRRDSSRTKFAGDKPYGQVKCYQVTVIDPDPDSDIPDKIAELPMCSFNRFYAAEQLNHDVFKLFF